MNEEIIVAVYDTEAHAAAAVRSVISSASIPGSGSLLTHRWRKPDSNPRSPDRGQHFSRRETSSIPYPLTTRSEIVHQAKSG
jgi:hypothetical protein